MKYVLPFNRFVAVWLGLLLSVQVLAQCPNNYTASSTNASCKGAKDGTISVVVADGVTPFYFIAWVFKGGVLTPVIGAKQKVEADGRTVTFSELGGLPPGSSYMISISQEDCEDAFTFPISLREPSELVLTVAAKTDVTGCYGDKTGSFTVASSGGNGGSAAHLYSFENGPYEAVKTFGNLAAGTYNVKVKDPKGCITETTVTIVQPTQLTVSLAGQANPLCAGSATGSISVAAAGGTPGYQYVLNGGAPTATPAFSNLPAGTYTIEAIDAKGCKATLPGVTLADPAVLTAAVNTKADASCNGVTDGSATVDVSGGTAPYTFSWNTTPVQNAATAANLGAGAYTVTVTDANACTRTANVTIGQPASVAPPAVTNAAICVGLPVPTLTAAGANGADITWYGENGDKTGTGSTFKPTADQVNNRVAGTHTFYATQTVGGCESPKTAVTLAIHAFPNAPVANSPAPICAGQDIPTLSATGTNPTWYDNAATVLSKNNTFTPVIDKSVAGTYTFYVTQTENNCESISTAVTVTIHPAPAKPAITGALSFCQGGNTQLTSSAASDNQWLLNGNPVAGETGQILTVTAPGTYAVRVTNASNCAVTSDPVTVSQTATPAAPTVTDVAYCQNATPAPLTAGGNDVRWYTTATSTDASTTPPAITTTTLGSTQYFVSQTVNGCESPRARLTLTVHPNPALPTISGNAAFCAGGNTVLTSSAAAGNQWLREGAPLSGATGQTLTVSQAGSYSVQVTNANGCVAASAPLAVTQTTVAAPTISGTLALCQGGSTVLTSSAPSGNQWNLEGTPIEGQTSQTLTVTRAGNYSVTLSQNGCAATSAPARVSVTPAPAAPSAGSNGPVCAGGTINLTAGTVAGATYAWTGPNGFASSQQNPTIPNAAPSASGTYSVVATVNGCASSPATVAVQVDPQVATPTISGNNTFCPGGNIVLTSSAATGNQWLKDGMAVAGATGQTLTVSAAGAYSVRVASGACSANAVAFNVTQTNVTTPVISGPLTFCQGGSTVLTASTSAGNQWLKDGVAVGGATGQTLTVTAPGDYTVTTTSGGCTAASAVARVTATPVPMAPVAGSNGPVCAGAPLNLTASAVAGGTYAWTGPNGFTSAIQNPSVSSATAAAGGTYSVTVTVNGCTSPAATVDVTVNPVPAAPTISGNNAICPGATTVLTSSAATGNQWSRDGVLLSGETAQTLTVATGGNYSVRVTSTGGCATTSAAFAVSQTSLAVPTISGNNAYCTGGSTVLSSSATSGNQWYRNGTPIGGATAQTLTAAAPGDYSVVATAGGCTATSVVVSVTETPAPAAPVASSNGPLCAGNTLRLTASVVAGASYTWTGPNGFTATGQNVSVPNATAGHSGRYTVTVTTNGCSNAAAVDVTVSPLPATPAISGTGTICAGGNTLLTSSAASGNQWYKDGVLIGGATGQTLSVNAAGAYAVTMGNAAGCSATSNAFAVTQAAPFTVNVAGTNPNGCTASNGTLSVTASPAGSYAYSLNGTDFSNTSGVFNGLGAGNYTVYVRNGAGCVVQGVHQLTNGTLSASVAATGETACNALDGTITLSPAGGSGSYTYAFRMGSAGEYTSMGSVNTLSGREPGTYFLRVSDAGTGCDFETTATVTRFDCNAPVCTLTATRTVTQPTCSNPNGSIVLTASGGTAPYTYSLNGTAFGSNNVLTAPANTYSQVTVRDAANCVYVLPAITLSAPTQPSAPVAANPAPVCAGGDAPQLTASGSGLQWYRDAGLTDRVGIGSPFIPAMNTGAAGTTSFYVTQTTANGCQSPAATVVVSVSVPASFNLSKTDPTGCATADGTITVTGVTGGAGTYGYSLDGTTYQAGATFSGRGAGNYTVYVKDANNCVATQSVQLAAPGGFTATVTPTNETGCDAKDGMIRVTGLPANAAGYHYFLDGDPNWAGAGIPVFTGLEPRTYTVRVEAQTPDKCSYTTTIAVGTDCVRSCVITASLSDKTDPACPGGADGSLTVSASGGSGTYEYSKDGVSFQDAATFNGLNAGNYNITVRDKNNSSCRFVLSGIALSDPDALATNAQPSQPTCAGNDGSLTVTATGGWGTYNYSVEDGNGVVTTNATGAFADLVAGSYTVTVQDGKGCTITLNPVTLTAGPALTASVSGTNPTACGTDNGAITVNNATGGTAPYSYSLDGVVYQSEPTFSGRPAGSYTVYVRDAKGCAITRTHTLTAPGGITATTGWTDETACNAADGTITVTGVTGAAGPFTYFRGTVSDADGVFTNLAPGTYTIRVVAPNNCEYTTAVTVGTACSNPPVCTLAAGSSKADPTCASLNGGSITVTVTGGTAPYQYAVNSPTFVNGTGVFNNLPAGNYNITVRDDAGCTFSLNTIALVAPAVPAAPAAASPAPVCPGETLPTLTATGAGIRWYDANNLVVATNNDFTPVMSNPVAGTYSYFATQTVNGCESARTTVTITIKAQPAAPTVTDVAYCQNATPAPLTAGGNDVRWYPVATGGNGTTAPPAVQTQTAGVTEYFVSQTVNGCESPRARLTLTVHPNPALPTVSGNAAFCAGGNTVLASSAAAGNQWLREGAPLSGATGQTLTVSQAGSYSVQVTNANGCVAASAPLAVTQTTVAAPTISGTLALCQGGSTVLTSSAPSGNQWNLEGTPIEGQTSQTLTVTRAGNYSVTLSQNGCAATSAPARVSVTPAPAAPSAGSNGPVCVGSPIELAASLVDGAAYNWTGPDGFASTLRNPVINAAAAASAGTYSVTVTVNGCTSPAAAVNVTVNPAFDFTLSGTAPTGCGAQDGRINVTPSVAGTYSYRVDNGAFSPSSDVLTNLSAGTYTVYLRNAAGCVVQQTYQLAGPGGFTAAAVSTNEMACGAADGTITVTPSPADANYRYAIRRSGETTYGPESNGAVFPNLTPGDYQVKVTDGNGCEFVASATVAGFACPPVCTLTAQVTGTTQPTCANPNGGAIAVTPTGGTAPYTYSVNNTPFAGIEALRGLGAGSYVVRVRDAAGCLRTLAAVTLTAPDGPAAPVLTGPAPVCNGAAIALSASTNQAGAAYQWTGPNGFTATGGQVTIPNATAAHAGTYAATVTVNGCVSPAAIVEVTVKPAVAAPAVADVTYCAGVQASALTATGNQLQWYNAAGDRLTAAPTPSTTTAGPQEFYVSQTVDGCESPRARITVTVKPATDPSCGCNLVAQAVNVKPVKCEGENNGEVQIFILAGGSGAYEYSKESGPFQDDPASLVKGLTAGTYNFTVRDKVTGCVVPVQAKVTTEVIVAGLIIASPANTCGGTGSIEFREVSGTGTAPYRVSIDGGTNYNDWPAGKLFAGLTPDTYPVAIRDANGCTYQTPVAITGMPKVAVAASVARQPATCSTTDGEVTVAVTGGTGPFQYLLNNEPVTLDASGKIGRLAAGRYTITVRDANQCDATTTISIAVDPIEFTVEREEATCEKPLVAARAMVALQAGEQLSNYLFSLDGATFVPANPEFTNLSPGTYTMYVRRNGLNSCPVSKKFTITGVKGIAYEVSQVNVGCTGGAEGSITVLDIKGGTLNNADAEYGISIDGGATFKYTAENKMTFEALTPGKYQVVLTYGTGCRTAAREVVISSSGIPFSVLTTPATCGSPSGSAEAVVGETGKKYFYSINNTNFFDAPLFTNLKPGEYKMYIRENADDRCANVLPFVVGGPDSLKARVRRENCNDIVLSPITGGVRPYRISVDGGKSFVSGNLFTGSYVVSNLPDGNYEVVVADNQDCRTFPVKIRISNTLTAKVKATLSMPDEPTGTIKIADIRGGDGPYEVSLNGTDWAPVRDTSIPYDTTITGQGIGEYIVYVRDANGCVKVYPVEVKESTFLIPNVFTPNNDGINDTFFIRNLPVSTIVRIVNRWGKVVFESNNYQNDWNGGDHPDGIYYYTVNIAGQGTYTGWVQIWH